MVLQAGTLVIGYGSRVRGDDGIGQLLVEAAADALPTLQTITATQLTPELAEPISRARQVYFVDANPALSPGDLTCEPVLIPEVSQDTGVTTAFTHSVTPITLLTAARDLYGHCPPAMLISIGGESFNYDLTLSPALAAALPRLVTTLLEILQQLTVNMV